MPTLGGFHGEDVLAKVKYIHCDFQISLILIKKSFFLLLHNLHILFFSIKAFHAKDIRGGGVVGVLLNTTSKEGYIFFFIM